jgi:hypothetical protein
MKATLNLSPDEIEFLILGDSHAQNGIIPEKISDKTINLAASGENYFFCLQKLKFLLANDRKIKNLILTLGPHNVNSNIDSLWVTNKDNFIVKASNYWGILDITDLLDCTKQINFGYLPFGTLAGELASESFYTIEKTAILKKAPTIGGYYPNIKSFNPNSRPTNTNSQLVNYSNFQLNYLNQIIETCSINHINIVLLNLPTFKGEEINDDLFLKLKNPYSYLNMGSIFNVAPDYFADSNHLNPIGAAKFTELLSDTLSKTCVK